MSYSNRQKRRGKKKRPLYPALKKRLIRMGLYNQSPNFQGRTYQGPPPPTEPIVLAPQPLGAASQQAPRWQPALTQEGEWDL